MTVTLPHPKRDGDSPRPIDRANVGGRGTTSGRSAAFPPPTQPVAAVSHEGVGASAAAATLLGSFVLVPVFTTSAWLLPVLGVVLVVWVGGSLGRHVRRALRIRRTGGVLIPRRLAVVSGAAVPLLQVGLLACVLTVFYASDEAWAGLIPTPTSLTRLNAVLVDGIAELREQATPALPLTGLIALTAVLVGLVAVIVDVLAVGARSATFAGLVLLSLYSVPLSTIHGSIGLPALLAPMAGFALLLWTDQRRRLAAERDRHSARTSVGTGGRAAVRIGGLAVVTGLLVGAVLPILPEGSIGTGLGSGTAAGGGSTGTALDPAVALRGLLTMPEPIELLTVEANVEDLGHLRAVALDQYDADVGWSLSNLAGETSLTSSSLSPLPPALPSREVRARITSREHDDRFMPLPWSPLQVSTPDPENWRFDPSSGTVFGRDISTVGRSWLVTARQPLPSLALLQAAPALDSADPVQQRFTRLPELDPAVTGLVGEVIEGAESPYERARRIHDFLSDRANGFVYSLSTAPGTSGDDLVDFLRYRRGYCEQYAGAMAVMVRAAGVPARVVLGYTPGEVQADGTRLITSDDAHAWVEVFFAELGWVPFDPTPIAPDRAVDLPWAPRGDGSGDTLDGAPPTAEPPTAPTPRTDRGAMPMPTVAARNQPVAWLPPLLAGTALALVMTAAVAVPGIVRLVQRRRRVSDGRAGVLWDELGATVRDLGLALDPAATPRQAAQQLAVLAGRHPDPLLAAAAEDSLRRLALAEEAASYGPVPDDVADPVRAGHLRGHLHTARRALSGSVPRRTRVHATLWPASLIGSAFTLLTEQRARLSSLVRRRQRSRPA